MAAGSFLDLDEPVLEEVPFFEDDEPADTEPPPAGAPGGWEGVDAPAVHPAGGHEGGLPEDVVPDRGMPRRLGGDCGLPAEMVAAWAQESAAARVARAHALADSDLAGDEPVPEPEDRASRGVDGAGRGRGEGLGRVPRRVRGRAAAVLAALAAAVVIAVVGVVSAGSGGSGEAKVAAGGPAAGSRVAVVAKRPAHKHARHHHRRHVRRVHRKHHHRHHAVPAPAPVPAPTPAPAPVPVPQYSAGSGDGGSGGSSGHSHNASGAEVERAFGLAG